MVQPACAQGEQMLPASCRPYIVPVCSSLPSPSLQTVFHANPFLDQLSTALLLMVEKQTGQMLRKAQDRLALFSAHLKSPVAATLASALHTNYSTNPHVAQPGTSDKRGKAYGQISTAHACPPSSWIVEPQDTDIFVETELLTVVAMDGRRRWMDIQAMVGFIFFWHPL